MHTLLLESEFLTQVIETSETVETWMKVLILLTIIGAIYPFYVLQKQKDQSRVLANRFQQLGNMTGKTKAEITEAVGAPNSMISMGQNVDLTWQTPRYSITIRFVNDTFAGILSEHTR